MALPNRSGGVQCRRISCIWRSLGKSANQTISMCYREVWEKRTSLIFAAFQRDSPNHFAEGRTVHSADGRGSLITICSARYRRLTPLFFLRAPRPARQLRPAAERIHDIGENLRNIVVEIVVGKRLAEGDRAGGKHRAIFRRCEEDHVGSNPVVVRTGQAGIGIENFLDHRLVVVAVSAGRCHDEGMRRRSQRQIIAVDFKSAGGTMREPEIAEDFALDALEDPGCPPMPAIRHPPKRHRRNRSLRR